MTTFLILQKDIKFGFSKSFYIFSLIPGTHVCRETQCTQDISQGTREMA